MPAPQILLNQTGVPGTVGPITQFPGSDNIRVIAVNPRIGTGFSGVVIVEGSDRTNPGNNDFVTIATLTFSNHTDNVTLEFETNKPTIRVRIPNTITTSGAVSVVGSSRSGQLSGTQGAQPASLMVETAFRATGTGNNFFISTIAVPQFTSDDVFWALDFTKTLTDIINEKQDKIGTGVITANEADVNLLTGAAAAGVTNSIILDLANLVVGSSEINQLQGITGNIQSQINTLAASIPSGLSGVTVPAASLNAFFNTSVFSVTITDIDQLAGLTATAADLNAMTGTAGQVAPSDFVKLGAITASASEINLLDGAIVTTSEINTLSGLTATTSDLNAITGLGSSGVTTTELQYLSGLTQNVQAALNSMPNLTSLVATAADLNLLAGAASGTGAYTSPLSSTEISYLNGLTGNIQAQLNQKRDISVPIGISEISGASITITELNYLQGARSNIQAQIDAITIGGSFLATSGGSMSGPLYIANGSAASPGLGFVAPNNNTGIYLYGANGFGISVGGVRQFTIDNTYVVVGDGVTDGGPHMRGPGNSVTDPAYAFTNDLDTGLQRTGPNAVAMVAGTEPMVEADQTNNIVTIGGPVASNHRVVMSGVFEGEKLLGRASVRAGSVTGTTGQTPIYTVPVGRSAVVTKIMVVLTNVTNFSGPPNTFRMNIGWGALFDDLVDNTNNPNIFDPSTYTFSTAGQVIPLGLGNNVFTAISGANGAAYQFTPAGATIKADVTALAPADDYDLEIFLMGVEF